MCRWRRGDGKVVSDARTEFPASILVLLPSFIHPAARPVISKCRSGCQPFAQNHPPCQSKYNPNYRCSFLTPPQASSLIVSSIASPRPHCQPKPSMLSFWTISLTACLKHFPHWSLLLYQRDFPQPPCLKQHLPLSYSASSLSFSASKVSSLDVLILCICFMLIAPQISTHAQTSWR